jgi:hypothetical protein
MPEVALDIISTRERARQTGRMKSQVTISVWAFRVAGYSGKPEGSIADAWRLCLNDAPWKECCYFRSRGSHLTHNGLSKQ